MWQVTADVWKRLNKFPPFGNVLLQIYFSVCVNKSDILITYAMCIVSCMVYQSSLAHTYKKNVIP